MLTRPVSAAGSSQTIRAINQPPKMPLSSTVPKPECIAAVPICAKAARASAGKIALLPTAHAEAGAPLDLDLLGLAQVGRNVVLFRHDGSDLPPVPIRDSRACLDPQLLPAVRQSGEP